MSNILPKKSWHVYNEDNRERVRKDEEEARDKKERIESRKAQNERQERLNLLRKKAGLEAGDSPPSTVGKKRDGERDGRMAETPSQQTLGSTLKTPKPWYERPRMTKEERHRDDLNKEDPMLLFKKPKNKRCS